MCWASVTSRLGGHHVYFQYNTTSSDIVNDTIEQLVIENMGNMSVDVLELKIT